MIKQVKDLREGDLVFLCGTRWITREGDQRSRVLENLNSYCWPKRLFHDLHGPVCVYAKRQKQ